MAFATIKLNSKVTLRSDNSDITYQIVSPEQVNPIDHKISLNSPLVKELLKNQADGSITVKTPRGDVTYEVVEISE